MRPPQNILRAILPACLALAAPLLFPDAALAGRQCREILETVEFPESLFIQDDFGWGALKPSYGGYDWAGNYLLDGVHVKVVVRPDRGDGLYRGATHLVFRAKGEDLIAENQRCRRELTALEEVLLDMEFEALRLEHEGGDGAATGERLEKLREEAEAKKRLCDKLAVEAKRDEQPVFLPEDVPPTRYRIHVRRGGQMDIWDDEQGRRIARMRPCAPFGPDYKDRKFRDERGVYDYRSFLAQVFFYLGPRHGEGPSGKPLKRADGTGQ